MRNSHNTCKSQYIKIFVYYIRHGFHYLHFDVRAKKRFQLLKNKIRFLSNVKVITFQGFDLILKLHYILKKNVYAYTMTH